MVATAGLSLSKTNELYNEYNTVESGERCSQRSSISGYYVRYSRYQCITFPRQLSCNCARSVSSIVYPWATPICKVWAASPMIPPCEAQAFFGINGGIIARWRCSDLMSL